MKHGLFPRSATVVRARGLVVALMGAIGLLVGTQGCPAREAESAQAMVAVPPTPAPQDVAEEPEIETGEIWFGVYMGEQKIGYQQITFFPDEYEGEIVQAVRTTGRQELRMMNANLVQDIDSVQHVRPDGTVLAMSFDMSSGGMEQHLQAVFFEDHVEYTQTAGDDVQEGQVELPEGARVIDPEHGLADGSMKPGDKLTYYQFVPILLKVIKGEAECIGDEEIDYRGEKVMASRVEHTTDFISMTTWSDADGEPLMMVTPIAGLRVIREPVEVAKSMEGPGGYVPPVDLVAQLEIKVDKPIKNSRTVRTLRLKVQNLKREELAISDGRQVVTGLEQHDDGTWSATYEITTQTPTEAGMALPIEEPEVAKWLEATTLIQCDNERLIAQAKEIVGDEKDAVAAAHAIAKWVSLNMRTRADIGLVRSSLEVLDTKEGVCRDYAALFAGLARAAGLPTRVVAGIVYWRDGFFYHAWDEVWLGEWIAFDSTVTPGYPVDATHIKFAEGDVGSMIDMISIIGTVELEIEDYE